MPFEYFPMFPYASLLAPFIWSLLIGFTAHFLVFRLPVFDALLKVPMVPPFIALPAIMFAFLMAFMASDAWHNIGQARNALISEIAALNRIVAIPLRPETAERQSRDTLKQYLDAVIEDEWKAGYNQRASNRAEEAVGRLESAVWKANTMCESHAAGSEICWDGLTRGTYIKALDDLRQARHQRLALGFQGTLLLKWVLALVLALITAISIAAVHRTSVRTAAIAQVLFCISAWMVFAMVSTHIQPYRGPDALAPLPLQELRARL